jgi:hypothetical protein
MDRASFRFWEWRIRTSNLALLIHRGNDDMADLAKKVQNKNALRNLVCYKNRELTSGSGSSVIWA